MRRETRKQGGDARPRGRSCGGDSADRAAGEKAKYGVDTLPVLVGASPDQRSAVDSAISSVHRAVQLATRGRIGETPRAGGQSTGAVPGPASPSVEALDGRTRTLVERTTGRSTSGLRVHPDDGTECKGSELGAARGDDIFLSPRTPGPQNPLGLHVRLHEATHALQARLSGGARAESRRAAEGEADRVAHTAVRGGSAPIEAPVPAGQRLAFDPADPEQRRDFAAERNAELDAVREEQQTGLEELEAELRDDGGADWSAVTTETGNPTSVPTFRFYEGQSDLDERRAYWKERIDAAQADEILLWITGELGDALEELVDPGHNDRGRTLAYETYRRPPVDEDDPMSILRLLDTARPHAGHPGSTVGPETARLVLEATDEAKVHVRGMLEAMRQAGLVDGDPVDELVSGYRSAQRQAGLYTRGGRSERDALRYSSAPGTSRHHSGTEFDLFATEGWDDDERLQAAYQWLNDYAAYFGFVQPYKDSPENRALRITEELAQVEVVTSEALGYYEEEWHWSYYPVAAALSDFAAENSQDAGSPLEMALREVWGERLRDGDAYDRIEQYWRHYIFNVNETPRFGDRVAREPLDAETVSAMSETDLTTTLEHIRACSEDPLPGAMEGNRALLEAELEARGLD